MALSTGPRRPRLDGLLPGLPVGLRQDAPNNTVRVLEPPIRTVFAGIHMAGPELTPETFRDGLLRLPVGGGGPTVPQVSRGEHGVWPDFDWGGIDDVGILWWDPTATGPDEVGTEGTGMYRYANGGERYTIGNLPGSPEEAGPVRRRVVGDGLRRRCPRRTRFPTTRRPRADGRCGSPRVGAAADPAVATAARDAVDGRPARPPTTVPLMRMYCRSGPSSSSSRSEVSRPSQRATVPLIIVPISPLNCSAT